MNNIRHAYLITYEAHFIVSRNGDNIRRDIVYGFNEKDAIRNFCNAYQVLGELSEVVYEKSTRLLTIDETVEMVNSVTAKFTITEIYSGLNLVFEKENKDDRT